MRIESAVAVAVVSATAAFSGFAFPVVTVMAVIVPATVLDGHRLAPRGGYHVDTREIRRLDQPVQPALEVQPVDDEQVRLADRAGVGL